MQTAGEKQEPTVPPVLLPPPEAVLEDPDFKKTAKTIIKQLVSIRMVLDVTEYHADVYYNAKTGDRPSGMSCPCTAVPERQHG